MLKDKLLNFGSLTIPSSGSAFLPHPDVAKLDASSDIGQGDIPLALHVHWTTAFSGSSALATVNVIVASSTNLLSNAVVIGRSAQLTPTQWAEDSHFYIPLQPISNSYSGGDHLYIGAVWETGGTSLAGVVDADIVTANGTELKFPPSPHHDFS